MVLVRPRTWPDTTDTAPNSPMARALHRMAPYSRPHLMFGSVTRQKICQPLAPSVSAACSSSLPCACISGISSRATNGKVTNRLARMMPGTAYTILMSCACNQPPNQPCVPNSSTKTSPATTGDTENGRSISVIRNCLPRNWNLVMAQAAAHAEHQVHRQRDGRDQQGQTDRRPGVRLDDGLQVQGPTLAEGLGEYRGQRHQQEQRQEQQRDAQQDAAHPARLGQVGGTMVDAHQALPRPRRACQPCSRLMTNSSAKDSTSITVAMAAAPA